MARKKVTPPKTEFSSYDELVRVLSEIDSVIFDERSDLRKGARAISSLLQIIENMLLKVFFTEYQRWVAAVQKAASSGEEPPETPMQLVQVGEKIHKLITNRGKFILEILKGKLDQAAEESEEPSLDFLKLPDELSAIYDAEDED